MDDEQLVARARAGDLEAASDLLAQHQDMVYTVALRLLAEPSDAEDLAQDALFRAYTRLADLQQGASFAGWLRRITINLCFNALRRRGQVQFEPLDVELPPSAPAALPDMQPPTPEDCALAHAIRDEIDASLEQLPAEQRIAVVLRDMYGYDIAEIATLQQCGVSAAKMRIMRGRTHLRRLLTEALVFGDGRE